MRDQLGRRAFLTRSGAALAMGVAAGMTESRSEAAPRSAKSEPFRYCLNTSTIRGQDLSLVEKVEIAAKAGYGGIEPWINEIGAHVAGGGRLADLRKRIADLGLTVLLVEHYVKAVLDSCDLVYVLAEGRILAAGSPSEVAANTEVQERYLGTRLDYLDDLIPPEVGR